jgi:adenosylcobinamide-GDP ribazoletransferase
LSGFVFAVQHLTIIPLKSGRPFDERKLGRSSMFFPLVGLILATLIIALDLLTGNLFPPSVRPAILIVSLIIFTGGIHLDGFMDTADGVLSGRSRERKLEIMRDSRVGAFGVIALFSLLLLKYSLIAGFIGKEIYPPLIMMIVLGRGAMTLAIGKFPYARAEGLGSVYLKYTGNFEVFVAGLISFIVAFACSGVGGLLIFLIMLIFTWIICSYFKKVLGGLTGDTYGALNEILEVLLLIIYISAIKLFPSIFKLGVFF